MSDFIVVIQHCYFCKHSVKMSYELFLKIFLTMAFHIFLQSVRPLVNVQGGVSWFSACSFSDNPFSCLVFVQCFWGFQATPNHLGVSGSKPGRSPIKKAVFDTVVNFPLSKLIEPSWIWKGGRDIPTLAMRYSNLVIVFKTGRGSSFYSLSLR